MREKTIFSALLITGLLSVFSCGNREDSKENTSTKYIKYSVPVAGNSFITVKPENATETITNTQLENWKNSDAVISTYFRVGKSGKLNIGLKASVPNEKTSVVKVTVNQTEKKVKLSGTKFKEYDAGEFQISTPGYVKVDIQGIEKTGNYFCYRYYL